MSDINAIVAVDERWSIGKDNRLLFSIPEDMKFFRKMTLGSVVVLGRRNLESFPGGKPLPKRRNIVLSETLDPGEGYEVVRDLPELFESVRAHQELGFRAIRIQTGVPGLPSVYGVASSSAALS